MKSLCKDFFKGNLEFTCRFKIYIRIVVLFVYNMVAYYSKTACNAQRSRRTKLLFRLYNKNPQLKVQIAAIRIIKTLFIQGVFVLLVFIFFRFRLQILCKVGFHVALGYFEAICI